MLDTIDDNSLDLFFAAVETRHDSAEATSVVAATPPSYLVFERTRPMSAAKAASLAINHVDICVFARSDVQESVLDLPTYKSFELLPLNVRHGTMSFVLVVIYDQTPPRRQRCPSMSSFYAALLLRRGVRIMRRTLSVCLSVRLVIAHRSFSILDVRSQDVLK